MTAAIADAELVEAPAKKQSARALDDVETLIRLHRGRVFRFLMLSVRDAEVADILTQDCFLKVHRSRESFRGDCSVETWLMRVAVNLLRDYARSRKLQFWRRASAASIDVAEVADRIAGFERDPEQSLITRECIKRVWEAADRLPAKQREVFLLRFLEDKDVSEIAAITGTSESTAKSHLYRAALAVRACVGASK